MSLRWLGALVLTGAFFLAGLRGSRRLKAAARFAEELCLAMELLALELGQDRPPLPELLRRLANSAPGAGGRWFAALAGAVEGCPDESFRALWERELAAFPAAQREVLYPLGAVLGRFSAPEQTAAVRSAERRLERLAAQAREKSRSCGRLYIGLSAALGAAVSVMLL